jgi:hypothetical protein
MTSSISAFVTLFVFTISVSGIGTGTANNSDTVGFVKEDNQRDTISLLISCFATLFLCVYSAVHLNVPRKAERNYRTLLRELQWCVLGLFAPELGFTLPGDSWLQQDNCAWKLSRRRARDQLRLAQMRRYFT